MSIFNIIDLLEHAIKNNGYIEKKVFQEGMESFPLNSYDEKKEAIILFLTLTTESSDYLAAPLSYPITFIATKKQQKFIDNVFDFDNDQLFFNLHYSLMYNHNNNSTHLASILDFYNQLKDLFTNGSHLIKPHFTLHSCIKKGLELDSNIKDIDITQININSDVLFWFKKVRPIISNKLIEASIFITPESVIPFDQIHLFLGKLPPRKPHAKDSTYTDIDIETETEIPFFDEDTKEIEEIEISFDDDDFDDEMPFVQPDTPHG